MAALCLTRYALFMFVCLYFSHSVSAQYVSVNIQQGTLRGNTTSTVSGTTYYTFRGIPYAKPPVGELRFMSPQNADPWTEPIDAFEFGSYCRQEKSVGSEDCLFINVFTPKLPSKEDDSLLPVMVWIHGGAFVTGSGNINPGHLLDLGVVVVSLNYRLNVFGFLSLDGTNAPGNAGLKDQSFALRWVQNNIASFGGDPDIVTIFGQSAGGASVHYQVLSPLSAGLFHRAISESGSALNPWAYVDQTQERAFRLGSYLGHETEDTQDLLDFLRTLTGSQLQKALSHVLTEEEKAHFILSPFIPCLEYPRSDEQPFLPYYPYYIEVNGLYNKVPYITGVNINEAASFVNNYNNTAPSYWEEIVNDLERIVPIDLGLTKGSAQSVEVANKIKEFYFGEEDISYETIQKWIDLHTDLRYALGVQTTVHRHSNFSDTSTYNYQFTYANARHGWEVQFVFYKYAIEGMNSNGAKIARFFSSLWTSFAKSGVPSVEGDVTWTPVSKNSYPYLQISNDLTLLSDLEKEQGHSVRVKAIAVNGPAGPVSEPVGSVSGPVCPVSGPACPVSGPACQVSGPMCPVIRQSCLLSGPACQVSAQYVSVNIQQGTLRGNTTSTVSGTTYYTFRGIPYAKPPVGELRFTAPQAVDPWTESIDVFEFGSMCKQQAGGTEDCLFINVFTPKLPSKEDDSLLPVMVWIHGGAFVGGTGNIDPGHLLDLGVVVVSLNYRLNVFGFLSLDGTNAPGNAGLKDQSFALRWVQNNIASFGGDPDIVTIFGGSAGGASVHYQVLSPLSAGLFHRAISESGSALNPWAYANHTQERAFRLGSYLGHETEDTQDLLDFLRTLPENDLVRALSHALTDEEKVGYLSNPFVPSLEYPRSDEQPFLPYHPYYIEINGLYNKVPYITGVNIAEGASFVGSDDELAQPSYWEAIVNDLERIVPVDLGLTKGSAQSTEVANKIKEFYFGEEAISYETRQNWIDLQTDLLFVIGVQTTVHQHSNFSEASTYNYQFIYGNARHGWETQFVFYIYAIEGVNTNGAKIARSFTSLWTSFAKSGVPSVEGDVTWTPVSKNSYPYLQISNDLTLLSDLEKERINFWFDIYSNYYNRSQLS
uniref:Carboxylesterase type B domain-containing protein n=1 Tax=Timema monikensis TaxID=170555 RepID=A0A7R9EBL9_9NEOP|nr:unnamed protein product [Timema monikensis]